MVLCYVSTAGFHYQCSRVNDSARCHSQALAEKDARGTAGVFVFWRYVGGARDQSPSAC